MASDIISERFCWWYTVNYDFGPNSRKKYLERNGKLDFEINKEITKNIFPSDNKSDEKIV